MQGGGGGGGGIVEWTKQELRDLERRTRKLLTVNGGFHPRDCVARLHAPRKDGGRGLRSVEDCVKQARISLENYVQSSEEELLKTVRREDVENQETATGFKARRRAENIQEWKGKPLYGQSVVRQGENQRSEETWTWLKKKESLRERRRLSSLLHKIKQYIQIMLKQRLTSPRLILSVEFASRPNETINHIVTSRPKLAQKEYKR